MEKRVLCVDDEPDVLKMMELALGSAGYKATCTSDGMEALLMMRHDRIRVLLVDLRMPKMDGMELCRRAKELDPGARVYAISAYVNAYTPEQFEAAGFDGYLRKPFQIKQLQNICRAAFIDLEKDADASPA